MKLPEYNPEGRKLTFEQHMKLQKEYEDKKQIKKKTNGEESGRCSVCDGSRFTLRCKKGNLIRSCKKCGDERVF